MRDLIRLCEVEAIHPEVQQMEREIIARLKHDFPQVGRKIKVVYERRGNPTFDPWDFAIKLPTVGMNRPLAEIDRDEASLGDRVVDPTLRGAIVHEFGHAIDHYIIKNASDELKDEWFRKKRALAAEHGAVSPYAQERSQEWLPEQFNAEYLGLTPRVVLIPVLQEYLKKID